MRFASMSKRAVPFLTLSATALLLALAGCNSSQSAVPPKAPPALPVTVLEVQPQSIPSSLEVMGQTEGARETEVRARVGGILVKRLYQEGETVRGGQALFQIDRSEYEIALAQAKAKAEQAEREKERLSSLAEAKAISQKEYDDAVSAHAVAQAALRQAQLNLSWTTVTAPVAGTTGRAMKSEGNLISVNDSLLTSVYQLNPMWVRFSLAESDIAKLPDGRLTPQDIGGVELILPNGTVYPKTGRLNYVASTIDPMLGTRQLRAEFDNKEGHLLPGQFVRARLLTGMRDGVFLVPQVAVMQSDRGRMVMVVDTQNKVAPRLVQAGEWRGTDWVILGGLQAGDRVIVDNLMKLRPGMEVAPHAPTPPSAPPGPAKQPAAAPKAQS